MVLERYGCAYNGTNNISTGKAEFGLLGLATCKDSYPCETCYSIQMRQKHFWGVLSLLESERGRAADGWLEWAKT